MAQRTGGNVPDLSLLSAEELFDAFIDASQLLATLRVFSALCERVDIDRSDYATVFDNLKARLTSWKCQTLWKKLEKRAGLATYKNKPCKNNSVLVLGCGPCGLRSAIEAALLGAHVVVTEKRDTFSRNNVLHLWPFLIYDLKNLGAKKFFGKFCAGTLDHISIRRLQLILLKVALILGVQVYAECLFVRVKEPSEGKGWTAEIKPENHPAGKFEFDMIMGTDGRRHTLKGFRRKEFRGKLAIAITMNFINRNTQAEARVQEISGVAFIFNQGFFTDLKDETGIDLENIVYYKDETHYFVMTAKKKSLLLKGVLKKDCTDPRDLLAKENVSRENLLEYAREAAYFCTNKQLPHMDFEINTNNEEDIAMFDFTSMYASENAAMILEMKGKRLLMQLAGDSLMEPFWPTGSGCARGFLAVFDAAWMMRGWGLGHAPVDLIMEREGIYKLLAQTTADNLSRSYDDYTIDPRSRYSNASIKKAPKDTVKHYYKIIQNSLEEVTADQNKPQPVVASTPSNVKNRVSPELLLSWCQKHTKGYKNVRISDMSSSWKSGLGFCAVIHRFHPELIDFDRLNEADVEKNNELAFNVAEKEFGVPPQISASEMAANDRADILTIVTYLAQLYEVFKDEKPVTQKSPSVEKTENKHKSPLSKVSAISRISMRSKKLARDEESLYCSVSSKGKTIGDITERLQRRRSTVALYERRHRYSIDDSWVARKRIVTGGLRKRQKQLQGETDKAIETAKVEVECHQQTGSVTPGSVVAVGRTEDGWIVWILWLLLFLPRLLFSILLKDKRKQGGDEVQDKSSKKYKVSEEQKLQQEKQQITQKQPSSSTNVELLSYKQSKAAVNGTAVPNTTECSTQQTATGKSGNKIGELAELVFGEQTKPKTSSSAGKITTPIRGKRSSHGDSVHCYFCQEKIFVFERLSAEGFFFHRKCFKCEKCEVTLRLGNYGYVPAADQANTGFYCKQHYRKITYETPEKPAAKKEVTEEMCNRHTARRSHSVGYIDASKMKLVEKPVSIEEKHTVTSSPRKVLRVPQKLRDEIKKERASPRKPETVTSPRKLEVSPEICNVSAQSAEDILPEEAPPAAEAPAEAAKKPASKKRWSRPPAYNKYSKYEAKPLRRSSISTTRKSDKGTRRLFVGTEPERAPGKGIMLSPEAPPKPPRAESFAAKDKRLTIASRIDEASAISKRRKDSKRAKYPPSQGFPDSFLVTKAVDIVIDETDSASPARARDLREHLGESTPRSVGRTPSAASRVIDPSKPWTAYYRSPDSISNKEIKDLSPIEPPSPSSPSSPEEEYDEKQRTLTTLHEDREMSPTSPRRTTWWPFFFGGQKKEKKSKEEKTKEKKLKEQHAKEHKKIKKQKKRRKKGKKAKATAAVDEKQEGDAALDEVPSDEEEEDIASPTTPMSPTSPVTSDLEAASGYYESSDEEEVTEAVRLARLKQKRYQEAQAQKMLERKRRYEEFNIRLEMRQREQKRLRIAQSIQRELAEVEVRQTELEELGVIVEKKMEQLQSGNVREEHRLVLEWFDLVNRKNTLIRYESELVIHSSSIELEDQQQRLEQQIRELLMKTAPRESDQIKIDQLTRELVDIVEQRNALVELLEDDRKREQEEDEVFEKMMASKGFSLG